MRTFFAVATRRRSCQLMQQAFALADRFGISMDVLLDSHGTEQQPVSGLAFLGPLLFTPKEAQPTSLGPRITVAEVPEDLCLAHGMTPSTVAEGYALGCTINNKGICSFYLSPAFERDVAGWDTLQDAFRKSKFDLLTPPSHQARLLYTLGTQVRLPDPTNKP